MVDPRENEELDQELSVDDLKGLSGGINLPQGQSGNPTFTNRNTFDFGANDNSNQSDDTNPNFRDAQEFIGNGLGNWHQNQ